MRISDWSSDVCSSDLQGGGRTGRPRHRPSQLQIEQLFAQIGIAQRLPDLREVRLLAPQLELVAHAHEHGLLLDADRVALAGRDAEPAAAVGLDEGGRADQLQLQQAAVLLGPRQLVDPVAHAFRSAAHTSELQSRMRISCAVFCLNKNNMWSNYSRTLYHRYT